MDDRLRADQAHAQGYRRSRDIFPHAKPNAARRNCQIAHERGAVEMVRVLDGGTVAKWYRKAACK